MSKGASIKMLFCFTNYLYKFVQHIVKARIAVSNGREPESCLGCVYNFKLGCFGQ
jgi:hypothetical protein